MRSGREKNSSRTGTPVASALRKKRLVCSKFTAAAATCLPISRFAGETNRQLAGGARRQTVHAPRQAQWPMEIAHIIAGLPAERPGGSRRMPQMIEPRFVQHRNELDASRFQAAAQVVIFTAPAFEVFVIAVDAFIV